MLLSTLKNVVRHFQQLRRYPKSRIAFGSRVTLGAELGEQVVVESNCIVHGGRLGDATKILGSSQVIYSLSQEHVQAGPQVWLHNCSLGRFSYVSFGTQLKHTEVGKFCSIGPEVRCGVGIHPTQFASTCPLFYSEDPTTGPSFVHSGKFAEFKPIKIGNDVWIGARVVILDGVEIGDGAIVGAGAVVTKNVDPYMIVGGVPARPIRSRMPREQAAALMQLEWWNWDLDKLKTAAPYLSQPDIAAFLAWASRT